MKRKKERKITPLGVDEEAGGAHRTAPPPEGGSSGARPTSYRVL